MLGSLTEGLDPATIPEWHIEANNCESFDLSSMFCENLKRSNHELCDRAVATHADNDENASGSPFASMNRHGSEYNVLDDPDRLTPA